MHSACPPLSLPHVGKDVTLGALALLHPTAQLHGKANIADDASIWPYVVMRSEGTDVRWLRSFFMPTTSQTHCYFEGPSAQAVDELNQRAGVPFERIVEVAEMTPEAV